MPLHMVEVPLRTSMLVWGGVALAAALLAALLAVPFARTVTTPMLFASEAAAALGRGERVGSVQSTLREANQVIEAMRAASAELHNREERQNLLLGEFSHRIKNVLSVVLSLVQQTLAGGHPGTNTRETLVGRLHALARTHELLTASNWHGAPMTDIVAGELAPFGDRAAIEGPPVYVSAGMAQTFALILHELATNASKYGALSNADGLLSVQWWTTGTGDAAQFHFRWEERGGPPVVQPDRKGFGTGLLQAAFPAGGSQQARLSFEPNGIVFTLDAPLSIIEQERIVPKA
jgi:two-component sensor histidine kinase